MSSVFREARTKSSFHDAIVDIKRASSQVLSKKLPSSYFSKNRSVSESGKALRDLNDHITQLVACPDSELLELLKLKTSPVLNLPQFYSEVYEVLQTLSANAIGLLDKFGPIYYSSAQIGSFKQHIQHDLNQVYSNGPSAELQKLVPTKYRKGGTSYNNQPTFALFYEQRALTFIKKFLSNSLTPSLAGISAIAAHSSTIDIEDSPILKYYRSKKSIYNDIMRKYLDAANETLVELELEHRANTIRATAYNDRKRILNFIKNKVTTAMQSTTGEMFLVSALSVEQMLNEHNKISAFSRIIRVRQQLQRNFTYKKYYYTPLYDGADVPETERRKRVKAATKSFSRNAMFALGPMGIALYYASKYVGYPVAKFAAKGAWAGLKFAGGLLARTPSALSKTYNALSPVGRYLSSKYTNWSNRPSSPTSSATSPTIPQSLVGSSPNSLGSPSHTSAGISKSFSFAGRMNGALTGKPNTLNVGTGLSALLPSISNKSTTKFSLANSSSLGSSGGAYSATNSFATPNYTSKYGDPTLSKVDRMEARKEAKDEVRDRKTIIRLLKELAKSKSDSSPSVFSKLLDLLPKNLSFSLLSGLKKYLKRGAIALAAKTLIGKGLSAAGKLGKGLIRKSGNLLGKLGSFGGKLARGLLTRGLPLAAAGTAGWSIGTLIYEKFGTEILDVLEPIFDSISGVLSSLIGTIKDYVSEKKTSIISYINSSRLLPQSAKSFMISKISDALVFPSGDSSAPTPAPTIISPYRTQSTKSATSIAYDPPSDYVVPTPTPAPPVFVNNPTPKTPHTVEEKQASNSMPWTIPTMSYADDGFFLLNTGILQ